MSEFITIQKLHWYELHSPKKQTNIEAYEMDQ